jgi:hypothetical protein
MFSLACELWVMLMELRACDTLLLLKEKHCTCYNSLDLTYYNLRIFQCYVSCFMAKHNVCMALNNPLFERWNFIHLIIFTTFSFNLFSLSLHLSAQNQFITLFLLLLRSILLHHEISNVWTRFLLSTTFCSIILKA